MKKMKSLAFLLVSIMLIFSSVVSANASILTDGLGHVETIQSEHVHAEEYPVCGCGTPW